MQIQKTKKDDVDIAVINSDVPIIFDVPSSLDLIMTVIYDTGCTRLAINKEAFTENFFILSTGLAGEILQQFINYGIKAAIYGDFSKYTSKPLKDFMYESNHGKDLFFQDDYSKAVEELSAAK